jgi:hypothetical protein
LWFDLGVGCGRVNDPVVSHRVDGDSLLREAKEELASTLGSSAIEAERELIQIFEVFMADRSLVGSNQPPFGKEITR